MGLSSTHGQYCDTEEKTTVLHSPGEQRLPFQEGRRTVEDNDGADLEEEKPGRKKREKAQGSKTARACCAPLVYE